MPTPPTSPRARFLSLLHPSSLILAFLLASCSLGSLGGPTRTPLPPTASPTPVGPQTLNVCLGKEPSSLYLYGDNSESARAIRQAIYDGPFDMETYNPEAVILENVPSLESGGAVVQTVPVNTGQLIVDANGQVNRLLPGLSVRPAGCRDGNCVTVYTGGEIQLDQLVVTFTLKPGLTWSDGAPLSASDSTYSFELNNNPDTPGDKYAVQRTASYVAVDERTVAWTGLPGYLDPSYQNNFWTPLPRHAWEIVPAADLVGADVSARKPLGWGPYLIQEWVAGQRITLTRNPSYFRAAEGLPKFGTLNFLFVGENAQANVDLLLAEQCDLLLPSTNLGEQAARLEQEASTASLQVFFQPATSWLHLDFGIRPLSYDDGTHIYLDRPDFFTDVRMRQAIARCIDRQALITQFAWGNGSPPNSYLPPESPFYNPGAANYSFDPTAANASLDELGWAFGVDGIRVNEFFPGVLPATPLQFTLRTSDVEQDLAIAALIKSSLDDCGIGLEINSGPAEEIFAPGSAGPVFGRAFDLALFSWPFGEQPACYLYLSEAIPGEDLTIFRYGWAGWNISGWANPDFDAACHAALSGLPGEAAYEDAQRQAQAIFAEQIPALPLFIPYQILAARGDFCSLQILPGSNLLQDLESYGFAEWCQ